MTGAPTSRREAVHEIVGSRVGHIAVVVRAFEAALHAHRAMGPFALFTYESSVFSRFEALGEPAEMTFQLALNRADPQFEIIAPTSHDEIYSPWLDEHGSGLHHCGFFVGDVASTTERMEAAGYATLMSGGGHGLDGDGAFAYHDTFEELGYITETIEPPARRRKPSSVFGATGAD